MEYLVLDKTIKFVKLMWMEHLATVNTYMWLGQWKWTKYAHKIWPCFPNLQYHNLWSIYTTTLIRISTLNQQFNKQYVQTYRTQIYHIKVKIFLISYLHGMINVHIIIITLLISSYILKICPSPILYANYIHTYMHT